jgi:YesN/AraC family two-component response regulator
MVEQARILVVEDEREMCDFLFLVLTAAGYEVGVAYDGAEALDKLAQGPFDLVLSDIRMPRVDGLELLQRVREANEKTAFILMTAYAQLEYALQAVLFEADDYLTKPVSREDVLGSVKKTLDAR